MQSIFENISWGAALTAVGGLIAIVGAVLAGLEQTAESRHANKLLTQNAELNARIAVLSEQNSKIAGETLATVIGGDSFPVVSVVFFDEPTDSGLITCRAEGRYPLYDVNLSLSDKKRVLKAGPGGLVRLGDMWKDSLRINVGNLGPGEGRRVLENWKLPPGDSHDFTIFGSGRNGAWIQDLGLYRVDGTWRVATRTRALRDGTEVILFSKVDDSFPRNGDGQPDTFWWPSGSAEN